MTITTPRPLRAPARRFEEERTGSDLRLLPRGGAEGRPSTTRRRRLVVSGSVLLLVVGLFAVVVVHVVLAQQQFQLARLSNQVAQQQSANEQLSLQVAQLQAPSRIVSAAEQQMGMVSPPSVGYLVPGHTGAKVRAPAAAAPAPTGSSGSAPPGKP